ncbi:MAG: metallophosphoesterase [Candidatus Micrarchaeota archaeon]|nr:metallophosphoesterase [Candidatus Micrarchaeota archaeon]
MELLFLREGALMYGKTLVVADLHIGFEIELLRSGISVPSQWRRMAERIKKLAFEFSAREVLLLGDVRHEVPSPTKKEENDLRNFVSDVSENLRVIIVKGNHDGRIEEMVDCEVVKYVKMENVLFMHGHTALPEDCETVVMAHEHPAVSFRDRSGYSFTEKCWVDIRNERRIIIMPVFNPLITGNPVNSPERKPVSPVISSFPGSSLVYLLDGTFLGKLENIMQNR